MEDEDREDPMMTVFPRVTKCSFHNYGASGTIQKHDALCVLGVNKFEIELGIISD